LGRNHVHHDARRVDRLAAGHVEADPLDRLPALDDLSALPERGDDGGGQLRLRGDRDAADRLFDRVAHGGVEVAHGLADLVRVDADLRGPHAVEALRLIEQGGFAALAHGVDEALRDVRGLGEVALRAGNQFGEVDAVRLDVTEVNDLDHGLTMLVVRRCVDAQGIGRRRRMVDTCV
jgi:hypothetical protein